MSDRGFLDIDCESMAVSVNGDKYKSTAIGAPLEITKSSLIIEILAMRAAELMGKSKNELLALIHNQKEDDKKEFVSCNERKKLLSQIKIYKANLDACLRSQLANNMKINKIEIDMASVIRERDVAVNKLNSRDEDSSASILAKIVDAAGINGDGLPYDIVEHIANMRSIITELEHKAMANKD